MNTRLQVERGDRAGHGIDLVDSGCVSRRPALRREEIFFRGTPSGPTRAGPGPRLPSRHRKAGSLHFPVETYPHRYGECSQGVAVHTIRCRWLPPWARTARRPAAAATAGAKPGRWGSNQPDFLPPSSLPATPNRIDTPSGGPALFAAPPPACRSKSPGGLFRSSTRLGGKGVGQFFAEPGPGTAPTAGGSTAEAAGNSSCVMPRRSLPSSCANGRTAGRVGARRPGGGGRAGRGSAGIGDRRSGRAAVQAEELTLCRQAALPPGLGE
jgi:hypothetical protein